METTLAIVVACIGSTGMFSFIQFLLSRKDKNKCDIYDIKSTVHQVELGCTRTQLMVLMKDYNNRTEEIMKVARHYFEDLNGDWYMTTLFAEYCKTKKIKVPDWAIEK